MNICVQLFVWTYFHFSCWTPKNGIAGIAISISLLKTAKLSFKVVAPFYTPAGRLTAPFDILTNTWDCQCFKILTIWVCVYRYHIVTLICISLMTNDEFPWWVSGKESACQCWRRRSHLWVRKIPWKRRWQPTPEFLPGKSHGYRSLVGYSPWGCERMGHDWATKQQRLMILSTFSCAYGPLVYFLQLSVSSSLCPFLKIKLWKLPKCSSTDEWISKMWYICTMEYYLVTKGMKY